MIPSFTPSTPNKASSAITAGGSVLPLSLGSGLLHRCRERIYICLFELGEIGFEQRGEMLRAFQKVLTAASREQLVVRAQPPLSKHNDN
jgi:hypothetical protein